MSHYLLATHSDTCEPDEGSDAAGHEMSPEEMQASMECVMALEAEMKASKAFVFSGGLHDAEDATVVRKVDGDLVMTDGPYAETKEHIAGFYVIEAENLDEALVWANKVVEAIGNPIEVRPFFDMPG